MIEDDPVACQLVQRTLDRGDLNIKFELETVRDMASAKETLAQKRFDNILLDLELPDSNGIQSVKHIRNISPDIPIIVLSGVSDNNMERQTIREGADRYLRKEESIYQDLCKSICFAIERKGKEKRSNARFGEKQSKKKKLDSANNKCTHLEHLNEQLRNSCKEAQSSAKIAETKLQEKTDSLAEVVHELRTPLNSIIGFSDILSQEDVSDTHSEYIKLIQDASANLAEIINNILDLSKIEAEKLELDSKSFSLQNFLNQIKNLLEHSATSKGLDFQIRTSPDLPERITSDPVRLRQCLVNLLANAIKFTLRGHVYLTVLATENGDNRSIRFEVEDTGVGIHNDRQDKIFGAFVQAESSTSAEYGGSGLGLSITKKLVDMLKGTLDFTSEPEYGSVFSLSIPQDSGPSKGIDSPDAIRTRKTASPGIPEFRGKVLVIEDDPKTRLLINLRLNDLGLDVEIAKNETHATEQAASGEIDVIFTSIKLPEMDGICLVERIRSKGLTVPVIAIIETSDRDTIINCIDSGCDGYVIKPILKKELYQVLKKFLQFDRGYVELPSDQYGN